jgi:hypothetical protein
VYEIQSFINVWLSSDFLYNGFELYIIYTILSKIALGPNVYRTQLDVESNRCKIQNSFGSYRVILGLASTKTQIYCFKNNLLIYIYFSICILFYLDWTIFT